MTVDFPSFLPPLALVLATLTALALLISRDWRWSIAAIAIQYLAAFVLVSISWPLEMAIAKMIAGWMAGAILGMAMANAPEAWESKELAVQSARLFRLLAAGTVFIILLGIAPTAADWLPGINTFALWSSLLLMGMGLLQLGLTTQPPRVALGLLTVLTGFEILYAAVESSTLVAGLLASVNLFIALACAYLLTAPSIEEEVQ
ncbi:MAG TPA: hypothetical protein PKM21_14730 [Anaerolineales bacterium]|nr:hypothetical protein [Anaerolineales bacterium]